MTADDEFLEGPTRNTTELWDQVMELSKKEQEAGGVLDMDTKIISTITSHGPGYLNKDKETIVGFQTDKPFKRSLQPYGGIRMASERPARTMDMRLDPEVVEFFHQTPENTQRQVCFDAYTRMKCAHAVPATSSQVFPMLMDAAASSVITARVALYGVDAV
ncbi:MAG: pyruvate formate lyase family protein [Enterocloster sp.]